MREINRKDITALTEALRAAMTENRDRLIEVDRQYGDSDLGLTMSRAFGAAAEFVRATPDGDIGNISMRVGMTIARSAPSTMGTLMATGFMRGGKALEGRMSVGVRDAACFLRAFVDGLMERGKARPGDRTVIDALFPAAEALEKAAASGESLESAVSDALKSAEAGLESTRTMIPCHGKAACFGDKTLGSPDGGALVGMLLLDAANKFISRKQ